VRPAGAQVIAVLNPLPGGAKNSADFSGESVSGRGCEVSQRQTGNDRPYEIELADVLLQQAVKLKRVTGDDVGAGEAFAQQTGQPGRFLNGHQPVLPQAALEEGVSDRSRAWAEFQNELPWFVRKPVGHGAGEVLRAGQNRTNLLGTKQPFVEEKRRGTQIGA